MQGPGFRPIVRDPDETRAVEALHGNAAIKRAAGGKLCHQAACESVGAHIMPARNHPSRLDGRCFAALIAVLRPREEYVDTRIRSKGSTDGA